MAQGKIVDVMTPLMKLKIKTTQQKSTLKMRVFAQPQSNMNEDA
jgi:hypothetical protein